MTSIILRIGNRMTVNCRDFADASAIYRIARDESGEGASSFPDGTLMRGGRKIARISYNGQVWPKELWHVGMAPLYSPFATDESRAGG